MAGLEFESVPKNRPLIKWVILFILAFCGIVAIHFFYVPLFTPLFATNLVNVPFTYYILPFYGINVLGGFLPLGIGLALSAMFFRRVPSKMTYVFCYTVAIVAALVSFIWYYSPKGMMSNAGFIGVFMGFVAFALTNKIIKPESGFKTKSYKTSLFLMGSIPLSIITADLVSILFLSSGVIGGYGLVDGVLLSTIYCFLILTLLFAFVQIRAILRNRKGF